MQATHRWRPLLPAVCVLALGMAGTVRGQDKPVELKDLDQRIRVVLAEVINTGADLYNEPVLDRSGCYRLYQGALITVRPMLDHRPELQKAIDAGLAEANRLSSSGERAFALRRALDKIRYEVGTTWDRLGGEKGVTKVVDDFVDLAAKDAKVDFTRGGKFKPDAELKKRLVEMVSEATGGPLKYKGKSMKEAHKDMGITDAEFDAAAAHLKTALEKNQVKADAVAELLKIVETTRKDIVSPKKEEKKPDEKKEEDKKPGAGVRVRAAAPVAYRSSLPIHLGTPSGGR